MAIDFKETVGALASALAGTANFTATALFETVKFTAMSLVKMVVLVGTLISMIPLLRIVELTYTWCLVPLSILLFQMVSWPLLTVRSIICWPYRVFDEFMQDYDLWVQTLSPLASTQLGLPLACC
jgi:hypothetical protein